MNSTIKDPDRDAIVARWKIEKDLKGTGALDSPCIEHSESINLPPVNSTEISFIKQKYIFETCPKCGWLKAVKKIVK